MTRVKPEKKLRSSSVSKGAQRPVDHVTGAVPYKPKMSRTESRKAVNSQLGKRVKIGNYRSTVTPLQPQERELLIGQALEILDKVYVHLPSKRALHANDPIQSLRLLGIRQAGMDDRAFHSALMDVFLGLRDLHTNYILPKDYAQMFAFLPFRIEEFYEPGGIADPTTSTAPVRKYVVSWVSPANTVTQLKEGVTVTHWNGSPIDLAIARNGSREAGSNADARRAQGIESLTLRWLGMSLPPDEDWVTLTYTDGNKTYESRFDWEVINALDRVALLAGFGGGSGTVHQLGVDLNRTLVSRVRDLIFDPQALKVQREVTARLRKAAAATAPGPLPLNASTSLFPDVYSRFGQVDTPSGAFGYIRLQSFAPGSGDIDGVVDEFARILRTLPANGLILDVRGNGGGYINFGERILQMLTPETITPEPFHFLATPLTQAMATESNGFADWSETIVQGLESGASLSQGFPLSAPEECNSIGQIYQGPVVLITDALCYSTTDIFAAGFQDHRIGIVLGCHASTGAGGANVWDMKFLRSLNIEPANPFVSLPQEADMRVAARRCTRVGRRSGTPVEDYGVAADIRYNLTKADVVNHNEGLIAAAAKLLASAPTQSMQVTPVAGAPLQRFNVECNNIDRVDLFVNDRPAMSQNVTNPAFTVALPIAAAKGATLKAQGYRDEKLAISTRLTI